MYFRINSPNVVREYFDGEVVVVNLELGTYYSLENVAAKVWMLLEQGMNADEVIRLMAKHYKIEADKIRPAIDRFICEIVSESLVVQERSAFACADDIAQAPILNGSSEPFQDPTLRKYSDMQDLLLLDPIHDVDDTGWPLAKQVNEE